MLDDLSVEMMKCAGVLVTKLFCFFCISIHYLEFCMMSSLNRIFAYSLDKSSLLPSEKIMKARFLSDDNKLVVWKLATRSVNPTISFGNVVDAMENVFILSTYDLPPSVNDLNVRTINKIKEDHERHIKGTAKSREFGFVKGKIPSTMLARPSFAMEKNNEEEEDFSDKFRFYN